MAATFRCWAVVLSLLLATWTTTAAADDPCTHEIPVGRPKVGLVLGGGGARGAAHIGVIRLLQEMHIPIDYVAGTSMGSLVGAFYATGMTAEQLEATVTAIDFDTLFKDSTARADQPYLRKLDANLGLFGPKVGIGPKSQLLPLGAIHGQKIYFLFESLTSARVQDTSFDDLPIPYRAVATDIVDGEAVVIGQGNLAVAMRASMSVPGAFDPVPYGQHLLVDGGLADNVPIDVVRKMGADVVIAVDVGTPLEPRENLNSLVSVTAQLTGLLVVRNAKAQIATLTDRDVLITPALGDEITSSSFDLVSKAIPIGYKGALEKREQLARLSVDPAVYAQHRRYVETCVSGPPVVQFVKIDNRSRFSDTVIRDRLHIPLGVPLDTAALDKQIQDIYGLGFLDLVRYQYIEENGQTGVWIHAVQDSRGTRFLEWGLDVFSDGDDTIANLRLAVLNTALDDYGSQLRTLLQLGETPAFLMEMHKALGPGLQWYFNPSVFAERRDLETFDGSGHVLNDYKVDQFGGQLNIMREIGQDAAITAGFRRFSGHASVNIGDPSLHDYSYNGAEWVFDAAFDGLDDRYFPSYGGQGHVEYIVSSKELGADQAYQQLISQLLGAYTIGRNTLIGGVRYDMTVGNDAPIYALFRGGGLFNLSGLEPNRVNGSNYGELFASYRVSLQESGGFFPAYAGVSAEFGNAGAQKKDPFSNGIMNGSVYFGYRSPIGPLYWGVGFAEDGQRVYFLRVGNVFNTTTIGR
ncbi:MAG TPA: patatin-like phospholipase family protein [Pseudomonadales bacterium]|nr:patatin-like phospholipase family protein [Pseudomonadales bacterium]